MPVIRDCSRNVFVSAHMDVYPSKLTKLAENEPVKIIFKKIGYQTANNVMLSTFTR